MIVEKLSSFGNILDSSRNLVRKKTKIDVEENDFESRLKKRREYGATQYHYLCTMREPIEVVIEMAGKKRYVITQEMTRSEQDLWLVLQAIYGRMDRGEQIPILGYDDELGTYMQNLLTPSNEDVLLIKAQLNGFEEARRDIKTGLLEVIFDPQRFYEGVRTDM